MPPARAEGASLTLALAGDVTLGRLVNDHAVIDAGADIFWGHSAHVDRQLRNDLSAVFLLTVTPPTVPEIEVVPVRIADLQANMARGRDRNWFLERFNARCAELGTGVVLEPGRVHVAAREPVGRG